MEDIEGTVRDVALWKLLALKVYIGGYHKGLPFEDQAYRYGQAALPLVCLPPALSARCRAWMDTIDAQVHVDSGCIGPALSRHRVIRFRSTPDSEGTLES